jgi:hypothetical protein
MQQQVDLVGRRLVHLELFFVTFSTDNATSKPFGFTYDRRGQIVTRSSPWRSYEVTGRDISGRLLSATTKVDLGAGGVSAFTESLTWQADGRQASHTIVSVTDSAMGV